MSEQSEQMKIVPLRSPLGRGYSAEVWTRNGGRLLYSTSVKPDKKAAVKAAQEWIDKQGGAK